MACIGCQSGKAVDELTQNAIDAFATHGTLEYKQWKVPLNRRAHEFLEANKQAHESRFMEFAKGMTLEQRVKELESCIVDGAPYEAQLLAIELLTRIIQ
jgi:hypothetical protein